MKSTLSQYLCALLYPSAIIWLKYRVIIALFWIKCKYIYVYSPQSPTLCLMDNVPAFVITSPLSRGPMALVEPTAHRGLRGVFFPPEMSILVSDPRQSRLPQNLP